MIKGYLDLINKNYLAAKKSRTSRFSIEWGKWSREMNIETRELIESKNPQALELKYVFIYWTIKSQLLELYHKGKILKLGTKKRLEKEARVLKKDILSGELSDLTEKTMQERLLEEMR